MATCNKAHIFIDHSNILDGGRQFMKSTCGVSKWEYSMPALLKLISPPPSEITDPSNIYATVFGKPNKTHLSETKTFLTAAAQACRNAVHVGCPEIKVSCSDLESDGTPSVEKHHLPMGAMLSAGATQAICVSKHYYPQDHPCFILATGDGAFGCLVELASSYGFPVTVWTWKAAASRDPRYFEENLELQGLR